MEPSNIYALARDRTQDSIERVEKKRKRTMGRENRGVEGTHNV